MADAPAVPPDVAIHDLWAGDAPPDALATAAREVCEYWRDATMRPWVEQKADWLETHPGDGLPLRLGAIAGGVCVGTVSLVYNDLAQRPDLTPWVASVLVRPAWRGRGIAAALLAEAERRAAAHRVEALYLFTPDAEAYYARLGWTAFDHGYTRGEEIVLMRKAMVAPHGWRHRTK